MSTSSYWSLSNPRTITIEFDGIIYPPLPWSSVDPSPLLKVQPLSTARPLLVHLLTYDLPLLIYSDRASWSDGTGGIQSYLKHHDLPKMKIASYLRPFPQTWFISARSLPVIPPNTPSIPCWLPANFPLYSWESPPSRPVLTSPTVLTSPKQDLPTPR